jgi:hypothetical protein
LQEFWLAVTIAVVRAAVGGIMTPRSAVCAQGVQPVNFTVLIPRSLAAAGGKLGRILQYGHGLFGDQSEVTEEYLDDEANAHGYVLCAVDWGCPARTK